MNLNLSCKNNVQNKSYFLDWIKELKKNKPTNIYVRKKGTAQHGKRIIEARGLNSEADLAMYNYWKFS